MWRIATPDRIGLKALRGERRAFAVLGLVLVVAQLLLGGLSQGAMAGERLERAGLSVICHTLGGENRLVGSSSHPGAIDRNCPCLAGACVAMAALRAPEAPAPVTHRLALGRPLPVRIVAAEPERRPLVLFARAGRGPPPTA